MVRLEYLKLWQKIGAYIQAVNPPCVTSLKIQQSCFSCKATLAVHNMTLLLFQDIASPSSQISVQNSASYPYEKLSPPETIKTSHHDPSQFSYFI